MDDRFPETLPDPAFRAVVAGSFDGRLVDLRSLDDYDAPTFHAGARDAVIETTPLRRCGWGELFAYMHRRFGPPPTGGDPHKNLSGCWFLTTPDPAVFLCVLPSLSGPLFSFRPYTTIPPVRTARDASDVMPPERRAEAAAAYRATLLDLLRPVGVDSRHVNALGAVEGDSPLLARTETEDEMFAVEPADSSCFGTPAGLVGGEDWSRFCALLGRLGGGDVANGRSQAVALMTEAVLNDAVAREPIETRILAAAGTGRRFDGRLLKPQERSSLMLARIEAMEALLASPERATAFPIDEATAVRAVALVDALAPEVDFGRQLRRARAKFRVGREWESMRLAFGDADFPDTAIPAAWPTSRDIFELPLRLKAAGAPAAAVAWSERLSSSPGGPGVVETILMHLAAQRRTRERGPSAPTP